MEVMELLVVIGLEFLHWIVTTLSWNSRIESVLTINMNKDAIN
jgi:hypothetical protein